MNNNPEELNKLIKRGSATAKNGFRNEDDVVKKFNDWQKDEDAQSWLKLMNYDLEQIEKVEAIKVTNSHKADVQVKIKIYLKDALSAENISIKLVSNPQGFNQVDKRWVDKYAELWALPEDVVLALKHFTGELPPTTKQTRDPRRMFLDEMEQTIQTRIIDVFERNKIMIITDILKGRDRLAADWMLIYQKSDNIWTLLPISIVMNFYGSGNVEITSQGSLRIGKIGMQRKGGDGGRPTANMLQFKINPCKIVNNLSS